MSFLSRKESEVYTITTDTYIPTIKVFSYNAQTEETRENDVELFLFTWWQYIQATDEWINLESVECSTLIKNSSIISDAEKDALLEEIESDKASKLCPKTTEFKLEG